MEYKEHCVCEEKINGKWSGLYSIRVNTDCNPLRFRIIESFDTFEEADEFARNLREHD